MKNIKTGTVAIIDSSYRFAGGWDDYYSKQLNLCGEKTVLTSWVWHQKDSSKQNIFNPYTNIVYEFSRFYDYLPVLKYNENIKLSDREYPYQLAFNYSGFYFGYADIFKEVLFDPSLNFKEQNIIYSFRLFTYGINLYIPKLSYVMRTIDDELLNNSKNNYPVRCGLFHNDEYYSRDLPKNYLFGLGKERASWEFFDFIHIDYK